MTTKPGTWHCGKVFDKCRNIFTTRKCASCLHKPRGCDTGSSSEDTIVSYRLLTVLIHDNDESPYPPASDQGQERQFPIVYKFRELGSVSCRHCRQRHQFSVLTLQKDLQKYASSRGRCRCLNGDAVSCST